MKPVDGSGGKGLVVGPDAITRGARRARARACIADPRGWIAQPVVQLSTIPTLVDDGMRPRHADLRPFAVNDGNGRLGAARRAHPRRAARGRARRQQLAGRRIEGHLGRRARRRCRPRDHNIQGLVADQAAPTRHASIPIISAASAPAGPQPAGRPAPRPAGAAAAGRSSSTPRRRGSSIDRQVTPMLSRIAESLFWIGRYIERSDGTARILDVHLQLLLEDPWIEEDLACRSLLSVMGTEVADDAERHPRRRARASSPSTATSRHPSPTRSAPPARTPAAPARSSRTELWEVLNTTRARMPRKVSSDKVHEFFGWVRERSALAVGIIESATSRDEAWQLLHPRPLDRARRHDRATARDAVAHRGVRPVAGRRSCARCGAYEAYLRTYRGVPSARNAAEFLLLDRLFPRSILFSVTPRRAVHARASSRAPTASASPTRPSGCSARSAASSSTGRSPRSSTTCPATWTTCSSRRAPRPRRSASATSRPTRRRAGWGRTREPPAHPAHDRLPLRRRGHRVVQRGADAAGRAPTASSCSTRTSRSCRSRATTATSTTGAPGSRRSRSSPRTGAVAHRDEPRRGAAARRTPQHRLGWEQLADEIETRHRVRRAARADPRARAPPEERRRARPRRSPTRTTTPCDAALAICTRDRRARSSTCRASTGVHTTAARGVGRSARASARTSRTSRSARCARSASRPATCQRLPAPEAERRDRRDHRRRVARLGRVVLRRVARLRPDQPHRHRRPPRDRRPRPRLQRRRPAARRLRRPVGSKLFVTVEITREA